MDNPVTAALVISLLGMPLLFLALAFFYALLSLLPLAIRERAAAPPEEVAAAAPVVERGTTPNTAVAHRAAAIAVALARAGAESRATRSREGAVADGVAVSAWWAGHHQRRLNHHSQTRRSL